MKKRRIITVGLDMYAADFTAAIAEPGRSGEVREFCTFMCDLHAVEKLMARLCKAHPEGTLHVAYEGGEGFVLARRLAQLGIADTVAAPSLMPVRPGERIKTDRCDAKKLARLSRAGELVACYVPNANDEAIRDLCRARTDAVVDTRRCKSQLTALFMRNGYRYKNKANWSEAHRRYLREPPWVQFHFSPRHAAQSFAIPSPYESTHSPFYSVHRPARVCRRK